MQAADLERLEALARAAFWRGYHDYHHHVPPGHTPPCCRDHPPASQWRYSKEWQWWAGWSAAMRHKHDGIKPRFWDTSAS